MRYVRFQFDGEKKSGIIENCQDIYEIEGDFFNGYRLTDKHYSLESVTLLPPTSPSKIVAIGVNYRDHATEMSIPSPEQPLIFLKPPSAVIAHEQTILHPSMASRVDYEGELAIVIGKRAKDVSQEDADQYILGVTICNDVTARDLQAIDNQWTRAKGFDTFAPLGPWIVNQLDYDNLSIVTRVNGVVKQQSNTNRMIHKAADLIAYVSKIMTLYPGDLIITGTPSGIGEMAEGDVVEVEIEGIGILRNYNKKLDR